MVASQPHCFLHVDASIGGILYAFSREPPPFDFRVPASARSLNLYSASLRRRPSTRAPVSSIASASEPSRRDISATVSIPGPPDAWRASAASLLL